MNQSVHIELARQLLRRVSREDDTESPPRAAFVPRSRYLSAERFALEQKMLFATTPQIVAHARELEEPGSCLTVDLAGVSILLVCGSDGIVRGFRNACRHRSTQLVQVDDQPCRKKAIVCPYHGWTYDLTGARIHTPHRATFAGHDRERDALAPAHVETHFGLVWASLTPFVAHEHLGVISQEIAALDLGSSVVHARSQREVRGNWKLIVDAFLDGYHIRHLHRDTVYRFFFDAQSEAQRVGNHIRAATARRTLASVKERDLEASVIRDLVTPSYVLFPNTVLILHPDYTSLLRLEPLAADRTLFSHTMLVPKKEAERIEHWDKSFALIDEGVFRSEDLRIVEAMQRGMASSADDTMLLGELEIAASWFHESIDTCVDAP